MDLNKLTQKAQEALKDAQVKAVRYGHQELDCEHLFLVLLEQQAGLVTQLLERLGVSVPTLKARLEEELDRRPRVSGGSVEEGKVYVTQRFNRLLVKAGDEASRLKDEYISVEHLLMAIVDEGKDTFSGKILSDFAIDRNRILQEMKSIRGNQRVTSDIPRDSTRH